MFLTPLHLTLGSDTYDNTQSAYASALSPLKGLELLDFGIYITNESDFNRHCTDHQHMPGICPCCNVLFFVVGRCEFVTPMEYCEVCMDELSEEIERRAQVAENIFKASLPRLLRVGWLWPSTLN
jgi:hypothetical protein